MFGAQQNGMGPGMGHQQQNMNGNYGNPGYKGQGYGGYGAYNQNYKGSGKGYKSGKNWNNSPYYGKGNGNGASTPFTQMVRGFHSFMGEMSSLGE
eukprot:2736457-Karenia_brevis.AAC.1